MKNYKGYKTLLKHFLFIAIFQCEIYAIAQGDSVIISDHYVLPGFIKGTVKLKTGKSESVMLNYNKITEEMIFEKGDNRLALHNLETIDTVYLGPRKFIPFGKVFYEVLIDGPPVSLYIRHKCNLLHAGKPSGYGGSSETGSVTSISMIVGSGNLYKLKLPEDFHTTDATQYLLIKDNSEYKINSENQLLRVFPEKSKELKLFIKQNKLNTRNQEDLIRIVNRALL